MDSWFVNGVPTDSLPIDDRGFQYADGLFETIAIRDSKPRFLDAHLRRLESGLTRLAIPLTASMPLLSEVENIAQECDFGIAKIIITRGSGPRGYRPPANPEPMRIVGAVPSTPSPRHYYEHGIALRVCRTPICSNPATAGIKTLGRLDQVLARAEWNDPEVAEGLMLDERQHIISGTMTNFFFVRGNQLLTPSVADSGIAGIMRGIVLDQAPAIGLMVRETRIGLDELQADDEIFVTNSQIGIWPVRQLCERTLAPGKSTRRLMQRLVELGVEECAP